MSAVHILHTPMEEVRREAYGERWCFVVSQDGRRLLSGHGAGMEGRMSAVGVRVCPVCGAEFRGRRDGQQYCGATCRNEAMKPRGIAGETAAIVKSEYIPPRTSKMTDDEFDAWYLRFRTELDHQPYHPGDLFWRRAQIMRMADAGDKTTAELARYFRVTPKQMRELIKAGRKAQEVAA